MRRTPLSLGLMAAAAAAALGGSLLYKPAFSGIDAQAQAASPPPSASAAQAAPQSVSLVRVRQQDVPVTLDANGTVSALMSVDLRAQTTSTVREVLVKDGDLVRKGQVLLRLDDRADRANLDKARAQLQRDRAALADAQRQYDRARDLLAKNFVSQSAVDTALANLDGQRAAVSADEAAVQAAVVALSYNELRAPFNGRIGAMNVFPGSLVQAVATATPLVNIAQIDPIGINFPVPETQLQPLLEATRAMQAGKGQRRLAAEALVPGTRDAAGKGEIKLQGQLQFVDNLVDASTGTIRARAQFDNARQLLWPGQYVRVRVTLDDIKGALVIPQAAIVQRGQERSVYVVDANKLAQPRSIRLIYTFGTEAVVTGLQAGEAVVVDGKQNMRPGTPVREMTGSAPAMASATAASGAGA